MDYESLSALDIVEGIKSGKFTPKEIIKECFKRINETDGTVNAFITLCEEEALERAKYLEEKIRRGEKLGRLAGVPIAIKDNICTKGIKTTCASKMLEVFVPPYHATVIEKLLQEDAIIVGKTNMDEFAMGSSTENSAFKITKNPAALDRVPGGSSGGSAAAVAAKMVPLALGSDTGGSIRQPAAFCGVVGFKPTYGSVSRYGLIAFGSSLDQIGPFSRTVEDSALLLEVIEGKDKMDGTSVDLSRTSSYEEDMKKGLSGLKVALPKQFFAEGLDSEIAASIWACKKILEDSGAVVEEVDMPISSEGLSSYYIISSAEASSNLSRYDGIRYGYRTSEFHDIDELIEKSRSEGFGEEVKRRIMLGTYTLSSGYYDAYYNKAQKLRRKLKEEFNSVLEKYDLILGPVSPTLPFKLGEKVSDPMSMYLTDIYTVNVNLTGLPAISMPCGLSSEGLPIGLQLIGPSFGEGKLFRAAAALEEKLA
ncbi:Asp-tRNA(Asn)/Glu-tRNA(Gln) amidotransferase subunit GatA [Clostridium thermarum]|uniref:Asp-tRNA(Asn)/Glu-tRNA(Gln) amidotransferase subunit GatA n=1 Tax=Clostridium thermarum TaxID=1716543 RepID=UPI0013D15064|nr:Asp-tRNA(Asn)/Glu-tRNA(Gln) amidotransferase subunit GatA [Clostridium thermarum]